MLNGIRIQFREVLLDFGEQSRSMLLKGTMQPVNLGRNGFALFPPAQRIRIAAGHAFEHFPEASRAEAESQPVQGGAEQVEREVRHRDIVPAKEDIVAPSGKVRPAEIAPG